jgi:lysophospholipase L1-like esterase
MRGPRIVALGDSITAGVGDNAVVNAAGAGWAAHVATALKASSFTNLAANGVRTQHMARTQVPDALMERPDVVLATIGGNDVLRGDFDPRKLAIDVREAVTRLARPEREIVLVSLDNIALFEMMPRTVATVMAMRVEAVNCALAQAVVGTKAVIVSGAEAMRAGGRQSWHIDRVHPSPHGHRAIADATVAALQHRWVPMAPVPAAGPPPTWADQAWWLVRNGSPWVAKRSRDLIPQVAQLVTHELLNARRERACA